MHVKGTLPGMYMHSLAAKAWRDLLLPGGIKVTDNARALHLKHDPIQEYRAAMYQHEDTTTPTLLRFPAVAFKKALQTAARDHGLEMKQMSRLLFVDPEFVDVYGVPVLDMRIVKQAGISRAPDVRTRPLLTQWTACLQISYVKPFLTPQTVLTLLQTAGETCGGGDYRPEKGGGGEFGRFDIVNANDPDVVELRANGGRAAQQAAYDEPGFSNEVTAGLIRWFDEEIVRRGRKSETTSPGAAALSVPARNNGASA